MLRIRPDLKKNSRSLRSDATDTERALWQRLRSNQLGVKFRRQHPIGNCIADFVCVEAKLVIELDGGQHAEQGIEDAARTKELEARGFRVLRFWNSEVFGNMEGVLQRIVEALRPDPIPAFPLPGGRRKSKAGRSIDDHPAARKSKIRTPSNGAEICSFPLAGGRLGWGSNGKFTSTAH
jgi:elongation factor P--(R)-beta-lysine ligase